ncbi:MAG: phosphoribosylformylglycinamidine cyclo-ligase [Gemmatimonadota bacterium]|nr:MAG: phosphoribosylformylglycinamidine cyclo-ligase [Gemmatimonadota bacterium]
MANITYKDAGVDINTATKSMIKVKELIRSTYCKGVLGEAGGFGGLFSLDLNEFQKPVLVSSIDGVGTKLKIAFLTRKHDTVGIDLVSHCANDIVVQGAQSLFFLDYFATAKLEPEILVSVVKGLAQGCREIGCVLIGGETAEMPEFYNTGEYDLAGTMVGIVDQDHIIDGSRIRIGDQILGLASNGLHTNGYSLVRKILFDIAGYSVDTYIEELGITVGEELLRTHKCYASSILKISKEFDIKGIIHITGGGFSDNIPRVLPQQCSVQIDLSSWEVPHIFQLVRSLGKVEDHEMYRTFNMGIGMVVVVSPEDLENVTRCFKKYGEKTYHIGEVVEGSQKVLFLNI